MPRHSERPARSAAVEPADPARSQTELRGLQDQMLPRDAAVQLVHRPILDRLPRLDEARSFRAERDDQGGPGSEPRGGKDPGETGAGKSILMGALSLILGDRADTSVLPDRNKKCIIEGTFYQNNNQNIKTFLNENELDAEDELMIRREIGTNGKSRAFVNDTPVNLDQLRVLSSLMVDLHRQFDTLELGETDFQREVIDALAAHNDLLNKYDTTFLKLISVKKELQLLQEKKSQFTKEFDYNKFLFDELEKENFSENSILISSIIA